MRTRFFTISAALSLAAIIVWISPGYAKEKVDCDKGQSIQAAVDGAAEGDTIEVSGICNQTVTISKDRITLDGLGSAQIIGPVGSGTMIRIRGTNVVIQRFEALTGDRTTISVEKGGSAFIEDNKIKDSGRHGVTVRNASYAEIVNNDVSSNSGGTGIIVSRSSSARIFNNTLSQNRNGIVVSDTSHGQIDGNMITGNINLGIWVRLNSSVQLARTVSSFTANIIKGHGRYGIECQYFSSIDVRVKQDFGDGTENGIADTNLPEPLCAVYNLNGVIFDPSP